MSFTAIPAEHVGGNSLAIIPYAQAKIFFVVTDFYFHVLRRRMAEGIAQRFGREPVDFVSKNRMQIARRSFHNHVEVGRGLAARSRSEFFPNRPNG